MRTVRFECLRPHEILEEKERFSVAYLPIGPLEWHGPHLPIGTYPLNAEATARLVAEPRLCGFKTAAAPGREVI
jgi:creatinine amidohydrolase